MTDYDRNRRDMQDPAFRLDEEPTLFPATRHYTDADIERIKVEARADALDVRAMLHTFFGLEHLGNCLGTDHRANNEALCARASRWLTS